MEILQSLNFRRPCDENNDTGKSNRVPSHADLTTKRRSKRNSSSVQKSHMVLRSQRSTRDLTDIAMQVVHRSYVKDLSERDLDKNASLSFSTKTAKLKEPGEASGGEKEDCVLQVDDASRPLNAIMQHSSRHLEDVQLSPTTKSSRKKKLGIRENGRSFPCDICGRALVSKECLRQHKMTHSEDRPYHCDVCHKLFRQSSVLINHMKTHESVLLYQCELCGNRYKHKRSMILHKERIHDGIRKPFPCAICGKVFSRKTKLNDHTNWHYDRSPHLCEHCGKRFMSRKTLKTHLLIHENKKPYPCTVCGRAFRQAHVLKRHLTTHTGIKPFRCEECGKQFIHRVYLIRHSCPCAKSESIILDPNVAIQITGQDHWDNERAKVMLKSSTINDSLAHRHLHDFGLKLEDGNLVGGKSEERNTLSKSDICDETDRRRSNEDFSLTPCPLDMSNKSSPKLHENQPEDIDETLSREVCDKECHQRKVLAVHMLIHEGRKPYQCEICHKQFRHGGTLKRHLSVHTGAKPYTC